MKKCLLNSVFFLIPLVACCDVSTQKLVSTSGPPLKLSQSTMNEVQMAILRAQNWLMDNQKKNGSWSAPQWPALTGLPLWALSLNKNKTEKLQQAINRAVSFLVKHAHEDGSIFNKEGGLRNYNTALCMMGLYATEKTELMPILLNARKYLAKSQRLETGPYYGGMGYDAELNRNYADMSNSYIAYEAMALTRSIEELRGSGEERADLNWKAAVEFLMKNQNLNNTSPWMHDDGGFVYHPEYIDSKGRISNKAGTFTNETGVVQFRSYGSMTYAGLLSFIYAEVDPNDYRVRSAFKWALNHWTLNENPGMGNMGRYYFYNVLAKGLHTMGWDILTLPDQRKINWRKEFVDKMLSLQVREDNGNGYWLNLSDKYNEGDKSMVTSYILIALQYAVN